MASPALQPDNVSSFSQPRQAALSPKTNGTDFDAKSMEIYSKRRPRGRIGLNHMGPGKVRRGKVRYKDRESQLPVVQAGINLN
jgi:hypothetical protein